MWHVSILSDNLQSFHSFRIPDYILQVHRSILLDPERRAHTLSVYSETLFAATFESYHGTSYASASTRFEVMGIAALPFPFAEVDDVAAILTVRANIEDSAPLISVSYGVDKTSPCEGSPKDEGTRG